jgi:hypothetical protein
MAEFTCTLKYPSGVSQLSWDTEPTMAAPCHADDTINFVSPDVRSIITFGVDSPFETAPGPKAYEIVITDKLKKVVLRDLVADLPRTAVRKFHFFCAPNGILVPGSGGSVPVGGGGN